MVVYMDPLGIRINLLLLRLIVMSMYRLIAWLTLRLHSCSASEATGFSSNANTTVKPIKLETGLRPNSAGIPYTLLLRIEAIGFPTFWLLLYSNRTRRIGVVVTGSWAAYLAKSAQGIGPTVITAASPDASSYLCLATTIGASIVKVGFGGPFYYNCNKEPPR